MTVSLEAKDVLALHDLVATGETVREGEASRTPLDLESGDRGLLYVWEDPALAERAARSHEVAGAELFAVPERVLSGPGWLVVRHPPGRPAAELVADEDVRNLSALGQKQAAELVESLGQVLRKLHSLPALAICGDVLEETGEGPRRWLTFSGWVAHHLEWFSEDLRRRDFDEDTVESLNKSIADMRHELSAFHPRTPPSFTHGKPSFRHVWVDEGGREVVGLTGFDRAAYLPREADLAHLLWVEGLGRQEGLARALYKGYGAARTMDVQRRERFYRRLVAFEALFGLKGDVRRSSAELVELTSARAIS